MEVEHAEHEPLLARVRAALETFSRRSGSAGARKRAELAQGVEDIRDVLGRHLAHEGKDALPLMGTHLTPGDRDAFVEPQRRANSRTGAGWFLLRLLEGAPPPPRAAVMGQQPRWRGILITRLWERATSESRE
jgi:hypothetical protein